VAKGQRLVIGKASTAIGQQQQQPAFPANPLTFTPKV